MSATYETLFRRTSTNPILTAAGWPYPVHTVFNAGATLLRDGTTLLLCRVEDRTGRSHLCAARSKDGVGEWIIDPHPTFPADPENHPEELWGVEDPRITWVEELGRYAVAYTAFGKGGPGVSLALTLIWLRSIVALKLSFVTGTSGGAKYRIAPTSGSGLGSTSTASVG